MSAGIGARPLVRLADGVLCQGAADEAVLLDLEKGTYYALNAVAARMLELARDLPDDDAVVGALAAEYDADEEVLRADLDGLLADLAGHGLLADDSAAGGGLGS